eukprot:jgi/Botrbrau1/364/Bobra.110_2s0021.1
MWGAQDWQVPLGRRFRALKLWFVLRTYGLEGLRAYIRHHVALAKHFAGLMERDSRFQLAAPPRFGLVCFRLQGATREKMAELLEAVNPLERPFSSAQRWEDSCCCGWPVGGSSDTTSPTSMSSLSAGFAEEADRDSALAE